MDACTCDLHKQILAADRLKKLIQFLAILNPAYDQVKVTILSMDPLPPVNRAYHILQQVKKQNSTENSGIQMQEVSALYSRDLILNFLLEINKVFRREIIKELRTTGFVTIVRLVIQLINALRSLDIQKNLHICRANMEILCLNCC